MKMKPNRQAPVFRRALVFFVLLSLVFSSFAFSLSEVIGVSSVKADTSISVQNTSLSVHVEHSANYKVVITNNCSNEDDITVSLSGIDSGWSASLFGSDNSTPLSNPIHIDGNGSHTIYVYVTPSASICHGATDAVTVTATSVGNNGCGSGSSSVTLTTTAINGGNISVEATVSPSEAKVGDTVTWTIHIKNTGNDPIGNVTVSDTLGTGCTYNNDIDFHGNAPDSGGYPEWVYNVMNPGADYTITFTSTVGACSNLDNNVSGKWGVSGNECQNVSTLASVKFIPTAPDIDYTISDISVPYCGSTNVDIPITNNGDGVVENFKLKIDTIPAFYTISDISSDWSYNPSTDEFVYNGGSPAGSIASGETVHLAFSVSMASGQCDISQGRATLKYTAEYVDPCGNNFYNPSRIGHISVSGEAPHFDLSKTGPRSVNIGQSGLTYTIIATYHKGSCSDSAKTVNITDTLPSPFTPVSASSGGTINGQTVIWSNITLTDNSPQTFTITFNVTTDSCYAHGEYTNSVSISPTVKDCCNCDISGGTASFATYINDPASTIQDSSKIVDPATIEIDCSQDNNSYTNPSGNSDSHNDRRYTTEYDFVASDVYAPTSWSGITFTDELQNSQFTNSTIANIDVEVDCGSGFAPVSGWTVDSYVPLKLDLSNLATCPPSSGAKLKISYTVRATQTDDSNNSAVSNSYVDWSYLYIPGHPRGCSNDPNYYQGVDVTDERANLVLGIDAPEVSEKCAVYPITIHISPENFSVDSANLTVNLNGFTYVSGSTSYSDSGNWCSGSKGEPSYDSNNGTLTWSVSQINEINTSGTITFNVKKDCSDNASVSVSSDYKDNCGKSHSASASGSSVLVKRAVLYAKITPQQNFANTHIVDWKAYITNGGDGTAREIKISDILGSGLSFNKEGCYVDVDGTTYNYGDSAIGWPNDGDTGTLVWDLNNLTLSPSKKITIYFKTNVLSCDENNLTTEVYANWCTCQESNHDSGIVKIPHSHAEVVVNGADFSLCGNGEVTVDISDVGTTHLYNVLVKVDIPKGLKYSSGSSSYTYNAGTVQSAGDPTVTQITDSSSDYYEGYELVWDSSDISELSELTSNDKIELHFNVEPDSGFTSCEFILGSVRKVKAWANFDKPCNFDADPPTEFSASFEKEFDIHAPDLTITKKTLEINGSAYTKNSHYFPKELGSQVVFEIDITNNGDLTTVKTNMADVLTGSNQHPLDYVSAQYSYDGGTWTNVNWDSAPSVGSSGTLIWNNIEGDLGHGIEPGKTLSVKVTTTVDSNCTNYNAYNYTELWTGCNDLGDMSSSNLLGNATSVSGWNGTLNADCPIYQAKYARVKSFDNSRIMHYSNTISNEIHTCDQNVPFEISFTNGSLSEGGVTLYGHLEIQDLIPVGATYVSGSSTITLPDGSTQTTDPTIDTETINGTTYTRLKWNVNTNLPPDKTIKAEFKLNFGSCSDVSDPAYNRQRLIGKDCSGNTEFKYPSDSSWPGGSGSSWVKTINILKPHITATLSVDKTSAFPGDSLLYMIHIKNTGDGSARHFEIKDVIPAGTVLVNGSITNGPPPGWGTSYSWMTHTYDSNTNTITWSSTDSGNDNEFPSGAETTVSFRVTVQAGASSPIENHAEFTDDCCYTTPLSTNTVQTRLSGKLKLTKSIYAINGTPVSGKPYNVQPGDIVTFIVKALNRSSTDLYNVNITDNLPQGWQYVSGSSYKVLNNGATPTNWGNAITDPTVSSNTMDFGLSEHLMATDDNGSDTGANEDTLWVKFNVKVTTSAIGSSCGEYNKNVANASASNDSAGNDPLSSSEIDTSDASDWAYVYKPQLFITKSVVSVNGDGGNTTQVQPGDIVKYKITVKNTAKVATAINVNVSDTLPNGFTYISNSSTATWSGGSSNADPSVSGNNLAFNYNATINAGGSLVIEYDAEVQSSVDIGKNTNSVSATGKDKDGGSVSATAPDGSANAYADVDVYKPVLRIEKVSDMSHVSVGDEVIFTIKVENLDSYAEARNVNITDVLPTGWQYVSGSSYKVLNNGATPTNWGNAITDPNGSGTLNFNLSETLQATDDQGGSSGSAADTLWLKFGAKPTNAALGCNNTDEATVSYTDKLGTSYPTVSDTANVCVCSPKLEMTKTVDSSTAEVNESRIFTLKIENKNPEDAHNVNVYDYLPAGWAYESGSGKYALTNGSNPSGWTPKEPVVEGYELIWNTNATVQGTDDNGGTSGSNNDTLFVEFKAHPTSDAVQGINVNRATAEGKDGGNNPIGTNVGRAYVTVNKPVISIAKTATPEAGVNGTITYNITITNTGNEDLANATITDTLPDGVTWQSGGTFTAPNTVTFSGLTVPHGGSVTKTVTVKVNKNIPKDTVLVNSASVSGNDAHGNSIVAGPATANTTVKAPVLSIVKSATPNPVKAGQNITYTITVSNGNGNQDATNVVITDTVPVHTTFVSADSGGTNSGGNITWNVGTVAAGSSTTVHFTVKVDSPIDDNTVIENSATANSGEQGPIVSNNTQTVVSSVPQLNICKSDSQDPVKPGNEFTYTIRYANNSTMDVTNAVITENYPAGITFVSANPAPSSGNNIWNLGTIPAGSSGNITITVRVNSDVANGTVLTNTVSATSDNTPEATATENTTVGTAPALTISKSDSVDPVQAGQNLTYTIHYSNTGSQDATGVVIEDDYSHMLNLPLNPTGSANVILVSHNETGPVNFTFTDDTTQHKWIWTANGALPGNSSGIITIVVRIPDNVKNGTSISDTATISFNEGNPATDTENTGIVSQPNLNLSKDSAPDPDPATPGGKITYTINYSNNGNEFATGTEITDEIPQHTYFVVGSVATESGVTVKYSNDNGTSWNYTPVDSGDGTDHNVTNIKFIVGTLSDDGINHAASFEVSIENPLDNGTVIENSVTISCNETASKQATNQLAVGSAPTLHITKTAPSSANAGDTITYTIEYWNDGTMDSTGTVITESYDPNLEFVSANPAPDSGTNNQWTIGTVHNDGVHHTITINAKIKAPTPNGTDITNTVTIDSDQTNPQQATAHTTVGSAPTLTITKTDSQDPVEAGDNIVYTITVGNTGNESASNVIITDSIPANTTFLSARFITKSGTITDPGVGNTGTVKWTLNGTLSPNEEFAVELIVKTNSPLDNGTVIHNTAHVSCNEDPTGKDATQDTTIKSKPVLHISKVDLQDPVQAGDNITYHITVTNDGNMNAHNVIITDDVPTNTTFVSAQFLSGGTGTITDPGTGNTGTVKWTLNGTLNVGTPLVLEIVVKTNSPLPNGTVINNTASVSSDEVSPISASQDTTVGSAPTLHITKTDSPDLVQAGGNITYTITVQNSGNMDATNVVITDEVPQYTTFVSAQFVNGSGNITAPAVGDTGTVVWTPNPSVLHQGESIVVQLVVKTFDSLPNGTEITNIAYADSSEITRISATQKTTVGGTPILQIDKVVYPTSGAPGKLMIYAINYRNIGNAPATNVKITETLPNEVEFYFANPSPTQGNNVWIIPELDRNQSGSITVIVKIKDDVPLGTIVRNTATISSDQTYTKQAEASFEVKSPRFWDPEHVYQRKVVSPEGNVAPGTWLTYTNYYGNSGNADATNVIITDTLDTNLDETTLVIYNGGVYHPENRTITWVIPVVHPGETGHVSFRVMVRKTLMGATLITNTSSVKSDQTPVPVMTNTVYNTVFTPCPPPSEKPKKPSQNSAINITINPPERVCIKTNSKFVFTFAGGTAPYEYSVDFGDGSEKIIGKESGKFITLLHNYAKEGTYTVSIDVKDSKGQESILSRSIKAENCEVVLKVYHQNFIIGYPDGNFKPNKKVTRAEIATMLARALGLDAEHLVNHISPFSDLSVRHWAFAFIKKAFYEKLMFGDKSGTFRPNNFATRAEIAAILVRIRGLKPEIPQEELFTDVKQSDWFNGYVYTAVKAGLIQGYKDHTFRPNKSVTRAEFVTMLDRALYREDIPQVSKYIGLKNIKIFPDVSESFWAYKYILEAAFPHIVTYATRAPINISIPSKIIPVYLASTKSVIVYPALGETVDAIVPVDGIESGKDPKKRKVHVKIINKERP